LAPQKSYFLGQSPKFLPRILENIRLAGGFAAAKERSDLAEGWKVGRRSRRPKFLSAAKKLQGRADLRATTQPDPATGRGSPKKRPTPKEVGPSFFICLLV